MADFDLMGWFNSAAQPACDAAVGARLVGCDKEAGSVELTFDAPVEFLNPRGAIQGGFAAAMLDICVGLPVLLASDTRKVPVTLNLNLNYLAPVPAGALRGTGRIVRLGRSIAYVAGELLDPDGVLLVTAVQTAKLVDRPGAG